MHAFSHQAARQMSTRSSCLESPVRGDDSPERSRSTSDFSLKQSLGNPKKQDDYIYICLLQPKTSIKNLKYLSLNMLLAWWHLWLMVPTWVLIPNHPFFTTCSLPHCGREPPTPPATLPALPTDHFDEQTFRTSKRILFFGVYFGSAARAGS